MKVSGIMAAGGIGITSLATGVAIAIYEGSLMPGILFVCIGSILIGVWVASKIQPQNSVSRWVDDKF